jgi:mono/diheme cytochrome c family protein
MIPIAKESFMRITHLLVLLLVVSLAAALTVPAFAQDGGATYKAKCSSCHGAGGEGKIGPALKGTSLTADQITELLTKGNDAKKPPHKKPLSSLSADDAKAVAEYVKTLK